MNYYTPTIYLKYAIVNDYTDIFATKVELNSSIEQTSNNIMLAVNGSLDTLDEQLSAKIELKVDTENLISEINASADVINLTGNRIIIDSENFKVTEDGTITANNATLNGSFRRYSSNTGYIAVAIDSNRIGFYDWDNEGTLSGYVGATQTTGSDDPYGIEMYCDNGLHVALGYLNSEGTVTNMISFDSSEPNEPPYIRNTATGTLFPNNETGGVNIKNGLITGWNILAYTGSVAVGNNVILTMKDGLVTNVQF